MLISRYWFLLFMQRGDSDIGYFLRPASWMPYRINLSIEKIVPLNDAEKECGYDEPLSEENDK